MRTSARQARGRLNGQPGLRFWLPLLLALGITAVNASAQFSGPTLPPSTPVNVPMIATTDPAILYPAARELKLTSGDLLTVRIYGAQDYAPVSRVSLDGTIQLPLIGLLPVEGLSIHQTEQLIASRLIADGMYRNPQVIIQLTESPNQVVTVIGEAHGVVPTVSQKRLFDVLAAVGGLPATASHTITIDRPGVDQPIIINLGPNPAHSAMANVPVFPRDTVIVARTGFIYVLGAFKTQGAIPLTANSPLTLMEVAALGGGPNFEGKFNDLRIIRTVGLSRTEVRVDIKKILKGKEPDPVLQADDIVFLPTVAFKEFIKYGGLGTTIGIVSFLVYAFRQ